ncbi:1,4-dihydroxy-2-naphthoate octaprenyltransferase [Flavobacterium sp. H122]|uniref:1,4-dihydroxy-2-naphthoate octaprenyltransferase n=1 Tax=Flavobacterium sp. H122 TaxID=2529860 RepID=UPI0010A9C42A|nr:1,4-dihydroxy-2-naphthoate octaprenyltransferase [Flavobacterium sp. H122]
MKHWIQAARLRTLPLSISGILVGSLYALSAPTNKILTPTQVFDWQIFVLALLTTVSFQVLSNFANDYGDGVKGTDADRVGEKRMVASGVITSAQMKKAVIVTALISLFFAVSLIYLAFGKDNFLYAVLFLGLGIASIIAAVKYTVGSNAYGYSGFGDIFVFIFFGLVSVLGSNFLYTKEFHGLLMLPAIAIGMLSTAVLNLNNMRDEISDRNVGKNTLVVKMGGKWARNYHYFLVVGAMILVLVFAVLSKFRWDQYAFIVAFFPLMSHLKTVKNTSDNRALDPQLKKLAISTFLLSLILAMVLIF